GGVYRGGVTGGYNRGFVGGFNRGYYNRGFYGFGLGFGWPYYGYGYGWGGAYWPGAYYGGYYPGAYYGDDGYGYGYPSYGYGTGYGAGYDGSDYGYAPPAVSNQNYGAAPPTPPQAGTSSDSYYRRPDYYLIAFTDHSIQAAVSFRVEGDEIIFTTREHVEKRAPLSSVDRRFSEQINRDRRVEFRLP
ncbi:MAG TPA: hypothetical protein VKR43_11490, partial [Bryobacteraceae bacterium]|nr:hypothetical protein [Bryobacteraceae bacterium]